MYAYADPVSQQEKLVAGAFAFGMHLIFLALLVFGVNWQKKIEPQVNIVDLWSPQAAQPKAKPAPEPPEVKPQVLPKVEPPPPLKAAAKPELAKPDIALKEKAEKERRMLEEKRKEAKKHEEEAQAAQKLQAAEAQRLAKEQEDAQRRLAEQAVTARQAQIDKYRKAISDKIRRFIVLPPNIQGNPEAEFEVVLLPGGEVLGARLKRASGNAAYDNAVERAILRAQPLPLPADPALFKDFRELNLRFRPQE